MLFGKARNTCYNGISLGNKRKHISVKLQEIGEKMSLILCPECKKEISDRSAACIHCGLPSDYFFTQPPNTKTDAPKTEITHSMDAKRAEAEFTKECAAFFSKNAYISSGESRRIYEKYQAFAAPEQPHSKKYPFISKNEKAQPTFGERVASFLQDVEAHNNHYVNRVLKANKKYFDEILYNVDKNVLLDDEQRRAVIIDDAYCLLIAGAGAGKTTTMAAKVKYLVDKQGVDPSEIVVISYTNKAISELKERINDQLHIPVKISTFHAFGYDILRQAKDTPPTVNYSAYNYVFDYLQRKVFGNKRLLKNLVNFLGFYFDLPEDIFKFSSLSDFAEYRANLEFETLKSRLGEYIYEVSAKRRRYHKTITGEFLRSAQEVLIANFLYMHSIAYSYEKPYPFPIAGAKKMYTPDFYLKQGEKEAYLEHFGITENFQSDRYTREQLSAYSRKVAEKRKVHKRHGTMLLETWSAYNDGRPLLDHLAEELKKHGFVLTPRSHKEIYKKLTETGQDKYVFKFIQFTIVFIEHFKTCGFDENSFDMLIEKTDNVRSRLYLNIVREIYGHYQNCLKRNNQIDFADMINDAEKILKRIGSQNADSKYRYIIIDEFQDIAKQRFNLTKTLADITGAKVIAVGDDWQSIFAFAGSDITLFQRFLALMGDGKEMQITHTYRNAQELIDIAGGFIQKNSQQIRKKLISPKRLSAPIVIASFDDAKGKLRKNWFAKIEETVGRIVDEYGSKKSILMIGRYNWDKDQLLKSGLFAPLKNDGIKCNKYPHVPITFLTAHSAKGLGFDNVILVNMAEQRFGFPSQLEDDPIMKLVTTADYSIEFAEERRLFYVALTRTKNRVYIIAPNSKPSRFILELIEDFHIPHTDALQKQIAQRKTLSCPVCGLPLKYENNKNYGIDLYICTNEPEICDFMTNDRQYPYDIYKCPDCADGYMVIKPNRKTGERFYGCTNFGSEDGSCKNVKSLLHFHPQKGTGKGAAK